MRAGVGEYCESENRVEVCERVGWVCECEI